MPCVYQTLPQAVTTTLRVTHTVPGSPRRAEVEAFIRTTFARRFDADIPVFAPNLMLIEDGDRTVAATGWRGADDSRLYLEGYLDTPIECCMEKFASQTVRRDHIVEVGNLAAGKPGASISLIRTLAAHLEELGCEWVVFTATSELVGIFNRLGLPLLALAQANPDRLGDSAKAWGSYYNNAPIVVAGRTRHALARYPKYA